jgi:RNA polymerase sigma-70 factor (ECF subfamily)
MGRHFYDSNKDPQNAATNAPEPACVSHKDAHAQAAFHHDFIAGEEKGFRYFFREYYPALTWYAHSLTRDKPLAEDIVSDAFIKLWERREMMESAAHIRSFLYATVRNACIDQLRRRQRYPLQDTEQLELPVSPDQDAFNKLVATETWRRVGAAIDTLPEKCRQVFRMIYLQGKDYPQVARELRLSINTIRVQKAKALKLLKQHLSPPLLALLNFFLLPA